MNHMKRGAACFLLLFCTLASSHAQVLPRNGQLIVGGDCALHTRNTNEYYDFKWSGQCAQKAGQTQREVAGAGELWAVSKTKGGDFLIEYERRDVAGADAYLFAAGRNSFNAPAWDHFNACGSRERSGAIVQFDCSQVPKDIAMAAANFYNNEWRARINATYPIKRDASNAGSPAREAAGLNNNEPTRPRSDGNASQRSTTQSEPRSRAVVASDWLQLLALENAKHCMKWEQNALKNTCSYEVLIGVKVLAYDGRYTVWGGIPIQPQRSQESGRTYEFVACRFSGGPDSPCTRDTVYFLQACMAWSASAKPNWDALTASLSPDAGDPTNKQLVAYTNEINGARVDVYRQALAESSSDGGQMDRCLLRAHHSMQQRRAEINARHPVSVHSRW